MSEDQDIELEIEEHVVARANQARKNPSKLRASYGIDIDGDDFVNYVHELMKWSILVVGVAIMFVIIVIANFEEPKVGIPDGIESSQSAQLIPTK